MTQRNKATACTRHVGGNGDGARHAGLRDDLRLLRMLIRPRVQHPVREPARQRHTLTSAYFQALP
jgi:hypothetical protein